MPAKSKPKAETATVPKRLLRSESDRMLGGVCSGIANYFSVDPALVRLAFVAFTIFGGGGVLAYLILWVILPTESNNDRSSKDNVHANVDEIKATAKSFQEKFHKSDFRSSPRLGGYILLAIGALFLLHNLGLFRFWELSQLWPLIIIAVGIAMIYRPHE